MASNPIEELIISLGLDASKLGEGAEASNKAIQSIRDNVTGLNGELKDTENLLKSLGTQFGGFGKAARAPRAAAVAPTATVTPTAAAVAPTATVTPTAPAVAPTATVTPTAPAVAPAATVTPAAAAVAPAATVTQDKEQAKAEAKKTREANALFDFVEKSKASEKEYAKVIGGMNAAQAKQRLSMLEGALSAENEKQYRPEDTLGKAKGKERADSLSRLIPIARKQTAIAEREEKANNKQRKTPHSVADLLLGAGGVVGPLAAGMFILKSAFEWIKSGINGVKEYTDLAMQSKQAGEQFNIAAQEVRFFKDAAVGFGDSAGTIAADMQNLGENFASVIPGKFNYGLQLMGIAVQGLNKKARPFQDVMNELADKMATWPKNNADTYRYFSQIMGMSKQTVDMMQQGSAAIAENQKVAVELGISKSQEEIEKEAAIGQGFGLAMKEVENGLASAFYGLIDGVEGVAFSITHPLTAAKDAWSGGGAFTKDLRAFEGGLSLPSTQTGKQSVNVTPSPPVSAVPYYGAGLRTGGESPNIEHMTVNVAIDKAGSATANVNGANPRRLNATLSPYRTAQ